MLTVLSVFFILREGKEKTHSSFSFSLLHFLEWNSLIYHQTLVKCIHYKGLFRLSLGNKRELEFLLWREVAWSELWGREKLPES